jgi:hypothetical protein
VLENGADTVVIAMSPRWTWREPELLESGRRSPGFRFAFPVSIGSHEFDSLDSIGNLRPESISAVSFVPGVEVEWPMSDRWRLKALGYVGLGFETDGDVDAEIFRLGIRSQLAFDLDDTRMWLVNEIERIGYSADDGSDAINLIGTGLDFRRPLKHTKLGGDPLAIHWHVMYTDYLDTLGLDLSRANVDPVTIGSEWELGVAFSKQSGRLQFWRLKFDRLGLSYRLGEGGEYEGIGIVVRSLFDR